MNKRAGTLGLIGILTSLCLLALFIPEPEIVRGITAQTSISSSNQDLTFLTTPLRVSESLPRAKRAENEPVSKVLNLAVLLTFGALGLSLVPRYAGHLSLTFSRRLQQLCRLTDLPPPALLLF